MSVKASIFDSFRGREAYVDRDHFLCVQSTDRPPEIGSEVRTRVFRQFFTSNGFDTGSSDMAVNGATTSQTFFVHAREDRDLYIKTVNFVIADQGAVANEFGNIGALSNGCRFFYQDQSGEVTINDGLVSNWEFVRMCGSTPPVGATTNAFITSNVNGTSEAYSPTLDFAAQFGFPFGLPLQRGSNQCLALTIRDNVSGVDQFDAVAYGLERFSETN